MAHSVLDFNKPSHRRTCLQNPFRELSQNMEMSVSTQNRTALNWFCSQKLEAAHVAAGSKQLASFP